MNAVSTVGIDLAKNVFSVHAVDPQGAVVVRRTFSRAKLGELIAQLLPCPIGTGFLFSAPHLGLHEFSWSLTGKCIRRTTDLVLIPTSIPRVIGELSGRCKHHGLHVMATSEIRSSLTQTVPSVVRTCSRIMTCPFLDNQKCVGPQFRSVDGCSTTQQSMAWLSAARMRSSPMTL